MTTLSTTKLLSGVAALTLVLGLAVVPVSFAIEDGKLVLKQSAAFASSNDDDDDHRGGYDDDDDDRHDDDDDDHRSGYDDDDDDRHDDDDDRHDDDRDDDRYDDDRHDDDNDRDDDRRGNFVFGSPTADQPSAFTAPSGTIVRKHRSGSDMEISYQNGWEEEIEHGRYILRDEFRRIVERRVATPEDIARMQAAF